jgi:hypothetical protein
MKLVGRKKEIRLLESLYSSGNAEFVAMYGRRRVGKTFLLGELFGSRMTFWHTGLPPYDRDKTFLLRDQLQAFHYSLEEYGLTGYQCPKSWLEAFHQLEILLKQKDDGSRQVVFIDELPWMDTARSRFIHAFEQFWNGWASRRKNIMLIVCGSATSWMSDNLINNKGGLYNRLTREIKLNPFTLAECEEFISAKGIAMSRYEIAQAYMILGGIPHYFNFFEKGESFAQGIDRMFFAKDAPMVAEYHRLFGSLFANADIPIKVIELLATKRQGFTRKEILAKTKIQDSGSFSETLNALQSSDLIAKYLPFGESKRNEMYKLSDNFCCFTLRFLDKMQKGDSQYWQKNYTSQKLNTWRGLAFEELCFAHISQIKKALGISGVSSTQSDWILQGSAETKGTQIDLLISRDDNVVNVCEIKYYSKPYTIDKNYDVILRDRLQTLIEHLPQKKTVHMTFISTFGLQQNEYSGQIQSQVVLDDLFEKE